MRICAATRDVLFWIPTREAGLVRENSDAIPENAVVRVSGNVIDGPPPQLVADDQHRRHRAWERDVPQFKEGGELWDTQVYGVLDGRRERGVSATLIDLPEIAGYRGQQSLCRITTLGSAFLSDRFAVSEWVWPKGVELPKECVPGPARYRRDLARTSEERPSLVGQHP
jgi:hypothetical protein